MKSWLTAATATLALMLAGCGDQQAGNSSTAAAGGAPAAAVPAPNGGDWSQTVSATQDGGFLMGNPNAPVKLVEYASMTCPHCADFAENGQPKLIEQYVKTGQVSFELRNFVRDPVDLTVSLLARCGGPTPYFKLTDQLFAGQEDWFAKLQQMPQAQQQQLQSLPPSQVTGALAQQADLLQFVQLRGIPADKAQQCLSNQSEIERLVSMNQTATTQHNLQGTPTFLINGQTLDNTSNWEQLEPHLKDAVG